MRLLCAGHGSGAIGAPAQRAPTRGKPMKRTTLLALGVAVVALSGCNKKYGQNNEASQIEANGENHAENVTATANNEAANIMNSAQNEASAVKNEGENKASAIKNAAENKAAAVNNAGSNATDNKTK
jgi:hypothetical protein